MKPHGAFPSMSTSFTLFGKVSYILAWVSLTVTSLSGRIPLKTTFLVGEVTSIITLTWRFLIQLFPNPFQASAWSAAESWKFTKLRIAIEIAHRFYHCIVLAEAGPLVFPLWSSRTSQKPPCLDPLSFYGLMLYLYLPVKNTVPILIFCIYLP